MLALLSLLTVPVAHAEDVRVTLSFDDAARHLVDVTASYPASEGGHDLAMANWTPGSYKIRDYAKHVEGVEASAGGEPVDIVKVAKNRWRIDHDGPVTVRYRVYAREMAVQTSFVDDDFAALNGASLFLYEPDHAGPWAVTVHAPEGWTAHTGLDGEENTFAAADLDELFDSPIVLANATETPFTVAGKPHELVSFGYAKTFDPERAKADLESLVEAHRLFWGGELPYERYVFLALGTGGGGGLEHKDSTLMLTGPDSMADDDSWERWLGLASHEFFHTWNIKRLRPAAYGPFDYEREVHSKSLWVAEGLTSYYADLLLHRAGLVDDEAVLSGLAGSISRLHNVPGREVRSLQDASFDAWIKHYQRDENTRNTTVSYYGKGAVVGWLLDAEIRRHTEGERSLDDALRTAYARYSGETGFTPEEFAAVVSETAGHDLTPWLARAVGSTEELDYAPALAYYGLELVPEHEEPLAHLGVRTSGTTITEVSRGSAAWDAGLAVDDELIAIDGRRIKDVGAAVEALAAGQEITVLLARRGRIERRTVTLGEAPPSWTLVRVEKAKRKQKKALEAWLQTP